MKRCIVLFVLTFAIIAGMWFNSPVYRAGERIEVDTACALQKDIYDSVIARGMIEEGDVREIRLNSSAKIKNVSVSIGDKVKSGQALFEVEPVETVIPDATSVSDLLPELEIPTEDVLAVISQYGQYADLIKEYATPKVKDNRSIQTKNIEPLVKSPISGVITNLNVKKNDVTSALSTIATVSDFNHLLVKVQIPELYISRIRVGQEVEITGEAFANVSYSGRVSKVFPTAKQKNGITGSGETVIDTLIEIKYPDEHLKPGYSVSTKIFTSKKDDAVVIPYECVWQDEKNRELIYVLKDNTVLKKRVQTGFELDKELEIRRGLAKDERVIVNPPKSLYNGAKVKVRGGK